MRLRRWQNIVKNQELEYQIVMFLSGYIHLKTINRLWVKIFPLESRKIYRPKIVWTTPARNIVATIVNLVDMQERKCLQWYRKREIELFVFVEKKKFLLVPTIWLNRYSIRSSDINPTLGEPNPIVSIASPCFLAKFERTLEEAIANLVTIAHYHFTWFNEC